MRSYLKELGKLLLVIAVSIYMLSISACTQEAQLSPLEVKHQEILESYDSRLPKRLKDQENENIIRAYKPVEDTWYYICQSQGYEEEILVLVGLRDERVESVEVIAHNETPGYGDYVSQEWFLERLLLSVEEPLVCVKRKKLSDNEVIAITGATITSEAVVSCVNQCIEMNQTNK